MSISRGTRIIGGERQRRLMNTKKLQKELEEVDQLLPDEPEEIDAEEPIPELSPSVKEDLQRLQRVRKELKEVTRKMLKRP